MIHWQWVITAFLASITLTLYLEIGRRRKLGQLPLIFYFLPLVPLLSAVGIWLPVFATASSHAETAVFLPVSTRPNLVDTQAKTEPTLPAPQITLHEREVKPTIPPAPITKPVKTAVRRLHIPALNLSRTVHTISLENGLWNVTDLGSDVGWLETTAVHPDDESAMVFVGHMTFANDRLLEQGAFADIPSLAYGTAVILETIDSSHTYLIDSVRRVSPDDMDALYQESGDSILLLTCADWNAQSGEYENRLLVRASKISKQ